MKKFLVILVAAIFMAGVANVSFAQVKHPKKAVAPTVEKTKGTIVSIDAAKKEIVVKDAKSGESKTFVVDEKVLATLAADQKVKITTKVGSNVAESVKVMKEEKAMKKK
ncbi:MAG: hypothetical protein HQL24_00990 [Candidatus Omnitrophica bacterium]|nr:hypothetical protein [Candidatus Omnitrophota bacterium]